MKDIRSLITYKNIYFIGIGGVSMSGIAHTLKHFGFNVSGSDASNSDTVQSLIEAGIPVSIGHNPENIKNIDLVVYTAAIAEERGIVENTLQKYQKGRGMRREKGRCDGKINTFDVLKRQ